MVWNQSNPNYSTFLGAVAPLSYVYVNPVIASYRACVKNGYMVNLLREAAKKHLQPALAEQFRRWGKAVPLREKKNFL